MFIERVFLFADLSTRFMEEIAKCVKQESVPAGAFLFKCGEPADYMYILGEGHVRLSYGEQGHVALGVRNSGDAFGWSSLVERDTYTASAECLETTLVVKSRKDDLARIFDTDPVSGLRFYKRLSKLLLERLTDFYKLIPAAHGEKHASPGF
jgi:CRP-like cAMP-binding protein